GECVVCQQTLLQLAGNLDAEQWQMLNCCCGSGAPSPEARKSPGFDPEPSAGFLKRLHGLASQGDLLDAKVSARATGESFPNIPGFEILQEVGRGGMAVVYKARQTRLNRIVALKVMQANRLAPERLSRARRGAEIIAGLKHPNILRLFEIGQH